MPVNGSFTTTQEFGYTKVCDGICKSYAIEREMDKWLKLHFKKCKICEEDFKTKNHKHIPLYTPAPMIPYRNRKNYIE